MHTRFYTRSDPILAVSVSLSLLGSGANQIQAASIVVPNALATQEGNSNNAVPFTFASRYQQVFAHSDFPLAGPGLITEILFRADAVFGSAFSVTIPDIMISLSTTLAEPDALNPLFSKNVGPDETIVYNGPLALSSRFTGPATGPKNFDISINLHTPFLYDPSRGNLLLDVKNFSNNPIPVFDAENGSATPYRVYGMILILIPIWHFLEPEIRDDFSNSLGLVTEFAISSVAEPNSFLVLGVAVTSFFSLGLFAGAKHNPIMTR